METRWMYRTSENFHELRELSKDTCVIPMGCVEKHGLHLPLGTDIIAASHIAYEASKLETFCVFPDFTFGNVLDNSPSAPAGTITMRLETFIMLLEDLCEQISRHGYKKILIYNGHGGNSGWLSAFLDRLHYRKRDYVVGVNHGDLPAPHDIAEKVLKEGSGVFPELTKEDEELLIRYHEEGMVVGHACMSETAFMMGITPENVHLDKLGKEDGKNRHTVDYLRDVGITLGNYGWMLNYPNAYCGGDPIGCNERIGKVTLRICAERLAQSVKVLKEDEMLLKQQEEEWSK